MVATRRTGVGTRLLFRVIVLFVAVLSSEHVLARRRWYHSRTSSHDPEELYLWVFVAVGVIVYRIIVFARKTKTSSNIEESAVDDPRWEEKYLEQNAVDTFFAMQEAWVARDMTRVRPRVTDELFQRYTAHFEMNTREGVHNIVEDAAIKRVSVLQTEDYKDDAKDNYSVCIAGEMRDYTVSDVTGNIVRNVDKELSEFADIYHFVRCGDKWLLREIDAKADGLDMVVARNYRER